MEKGGNFLGKLWGNPGEKMGINSVLVGEISRWLPYLWKKPGYFPQVFHSGDRVEGLEG